MLLKKYCGRPLRKTMWSSVPKEKTKQQNQTPT